MFNYSLSRLGLRRRIISYFARHKNDYPAEYIEKAESLKSHKLHFMPAELVDKYRDVTAEVHHQDGLPYVIHNGKKLFFRSELSDGSVQRLYRGLIMEQDYSSPHCYVDDQFGVCQGDVLLDLGAAEAIFTLDNIEKLEHAYLFECNDNWFAPLKATFEPWKDKVTIIRKYVSAENNDTNISIDEFVAKYNTKVNFIKMDIEGAECEALKGGEQTLRNSTHCIRLAICCYHRPLDCEYISNMMAEWNYKYKVNEGLLCYKYQPYPPYFRRGVIKASKN